MGMRQKRTYYHQDLDGWFHCSSPLSACGARLLCPRSKSRRYLWRSARRRVVENNAYLVVGAGLLRARPFGTLLPPQLSFGRPWGQWINQVYQTNKRLTSESIWHTERQFPNTRRPNQWEYRLLIIVRENIQKRKWNLRRTVLKLSCIARLQ